MVRDIHQRVLQQVNPPIRVLHDGQLWTVEIHRSLDFPSERDILHDPNYHLRPFLARYFVLQERMDHGPSSVFLLAVLVIAHVVEESAHFDQQAICLGCVAVVVVVVAVAVTFMVFVQDPKCIAANSFHVRPVVRWIKIVALEVVANELFCLSDQLLAGVGGHPGVVVVVVVIEVEK